MTKYLAWGSLLLTACGQDVDFTSFEPSDCGSDVVEAPPTDPDPEPLVRIGDIPLTLAAPVGGMIPQGLGMYHDGRTVDTVPGTSDLLNWTGYGTGFDTDMKDFVAFGTASTDIETRTFRVYNGTADPDTGVQVYFSIKGTTPTQSACLDNNPSTPCIIANTDCLASVRLGSSYNLCTSYRVSVYINNKIVPPADPEEYWVGVMRHEMGHVLGLWHDGTGPMVNGSLDFTPCQVAKWASFKIDPSITGWTYPSIPECGP